MQGDALQQVADAVACVDGLLEAFEEVLPAHDHEWVDAAREEGGERLAHDAVAVLLEAVQLGEVRAELRGCGELRDRGADLASGSWRICASWTACSIGASMR